MDLRIKDAQLETVAGVKSALPSHEAAEFAFAGKSNVGKSSLINALMNRKGLARTSATPGKTQTINFYQVEALMPDDKPTRFYLVDLPGYGYTKASTDARRSWGRMVERYLKQAETLQKVFLLVDIRHTPSANDVQMYDWIKYQGFLPVVVATKLDKLKKNEIPGCVSAIRKALAMKNEEILIPFSSETKAGTKEIYELICPKGETENG